MPATRGGEGHQLRYEDLMTDLEGSLRTIGDGLDLSFDAVTEQIQRGDELDPGHVVAGNRLRMANQIKLRPDTDWKSSLSAGDIRTFQLMCGWLQRRYGYS